MNIKILIPTIFLLALIPLISTTTAQDNLPAKSSAFLAQEDEAFVYAFVQITIRDSNDSLLAYIESDTIDTVNNEVMNNFLDNETSLGNDPIFKIGENKYQLIVRQTSLLHENETYYADTLMKANTQVDGVDKDVWALRFMHDGFVVLPGDTITYYFNFVRII